MQTEIQPFWSAEYLQDDYQTQLDTAWITAL